MSLACLLKLSAFCAVHIRLLPTACCSPSEAHLNCAIFCRALLLLLLFFGWPVGWPFGNLRKLGFVVAVAVAGKPARQGAVPARSDAVFRQPNLFFPLPFWPIAVVVWLSYFLLVLLLLPWLGW